ncbi:adhesion G-protein coupled receptor D1-like [Asterias amurensis]|uniref:adhesion G-protein coupled receptor D1-like n=1 Tax=Asterias amurensis TaxID=7602 RepID=UPI003AB87955
MSVSTDVEDAMEYLAGTLGQGNCTRATYDTASVTLCHSPDVSSLDGFQYSHNVESEPGELDRFEEELTVDLPGIDLDTDTVTYVVLRKKTPVQEVNGTSAIQFSEETSSSNKSAPNTTSVHLNSAILTFSIFVNRRRKSVPVNFSLHHLLDAEDEFTEVGALNATRTTACVFWVEGAGNKDGQLSTTGCSVTTLKSSSFCYCNHSTNFAVLMQVTAYEISEADSSALMWITYIGCCVSIMLLLLTLAIYGYLWKLRSDRIFIHSSLALAILIAQLLFIGGLERTEDKVVCKVIAILLHFFYLSVFGWMLVEGIHLYRKVIKVYGSENIKMYPYLLVGWGIPAAITLVSLGIRIEGYGTNKVCWLDISSGLIWAFVVPALCVVGVNIIVFILVLRVIVKSAELNDKEHANIKAGLKGAVVLLPILGLTWIFGILAVNSATIMFQYLFTIFNSFQGLFIFLNQCAFNSEVKAAFLRIREKRKLLSGTSISTDQAAHFNSTSVTQNTDVKTVSDKDTKKHPALDNDDLEVEPMENDEEFIQDLEKAPEPVSIEPQRSEPFEFYKLPPSANLNALRKLHSNKVYPKFMDEGPTEEK